MNWIVELDSRLTLAINSLNCPASDAFWMFMSRKQVWFILYAAFLGLMIWRLGWKKALVWTVYLILCIVCVDQFANLIKDWVCRLRPCNDPYVVGQGLHILEWVSEKYCYGFYSAHAGNSFAFAVGSSIAIRQDKRLKWRGYTIPIMIWATLVSLSRIFVGKHFLGDVLVGVVIGIAVAVLLAKVADLVSRKLIKQE